jgi:hypothetical protein
LLRQNKEFQSTPAVDFLSARMATVACLILYLQLSLYFRSHFGAFAKENLKKCTPYFAIFIRMSGSMKQLNNSRKNFDSEKILLKFADLFQFWSKSGNHNRKHA